MGGAVWHKHPLLSHDPEPLNIKDKKVTGKHNLSIPFSDNSMDGNTVVCFMMIPMASSTGIIGYGDFRARNATL